MQFTPNGSQMTPSSSSLMDDILSVRDSLNEELSSEQDQDSLTQTNNPIVPGELSEAFTLLDPDLAYLNKEMRSAAGQLELAVKQGHMIDMAQWRFDSAKSAYMTRLRELKDDDVLHKFAQKTVEGECDIERAKRDLRNHSMQEAMNEQFALRRRKKEEEKRRKEREEHSWFFYMMLGLFLMQMNMRRRNHDLGHSKMRSDFSSAQSA